MSWSFIFFLISLQELFATTQNFACTSSYATFEVPSDVYTIFVDMSGARGGNEGAVLGGLGGRVQATLSVSPHQILYVYVGCKGPDSINPGVTYTTYNLGSGFNGGGLPGIGGGTAGGGASDIRSAAEDLYSRLLVAGGGGGCYYYCTSKANGGDGGQIGEDGMNGCYDGGNGATQSSGGSGSTEFVTSAAGTFGNGGSVAEDYGGGGGGGYYGGGAGSWSGGGGGSSYASLLASSVLYTGGHNNDDGYVSITYSTNDVIPTTIPTTVPSLLPTKAPTISPSSNYAGITWVLASKYSTCTTACSAYYSSVCQGSGFWPLTSDDMRAIAAITIDVESGVLVSSSLCYSIAQGNPTYQQDPEITVSTCYYGGGAGTCDAVPDGESRRFCPCSSAPSMSPASTPAPTVSPTTLKPSHVPTSTSVPSSSVPTVVTWVLGSSYTNCDATCSTYSSASCQSSGYWPLTSDDMSDIAAVTIDIESGVLVSSTLCASILQGDPSLPQDPELTGSVCYYGGGVGTCSALPDGSSRRFCPCSNVNGIPTKFPTTIVPSIRPTTIVPSVAPSTKTPTLVPSSRSITSIPWILAEEYTNCNSACSSMSLTCMTSGYWPLSSDEMNSIAAVTVDSMTNTLVSSTLCSTITQGDPLLPQDPEVTGSICYYGGGAGTCEAYPDGTSRRFCPCTGISPSASPIFTSALAQTYYNCTKSTKTFVVPPNIYSITVDMAGARGGNEGAVLGGLGGRVQATISVTPGQTLFVNVGCQGPDSDVPGKENYVYYKGSGYNGGGLPATGGGTGGGGASDIRTSLSLYDRLVVAGGGGGCYYYCTSKANGGHGGYVGGDGQFGCYNGGYGATQTMGGTGTMSGAFGEGGDSSSSYGAGGGGGYYGGGAGSWSGGGGGSSYVTPFALTQQFTTGYNDGDGYVIIYTDNYPTASPITSAPSTPNPSVTPTSSTPTRTPNSAVPTIIPTFAPTARPTYRPTAKPTSIPTSKPSRPTNSPSSHPSSQPTSSPTSQPTRQPSTQPTSQPSSQCTEGYYIDASDYNVCKSCQNGTYSIKPNSYRCNQCARGSYSDVQHLSCIPCPVGTFSNSFSASDNSYCKVCERGTYNPFTGQPYCYSCPSGNYCENEAMTLPVPCLSGTYQDKQGKTTCESCPSGMISAPNSKDRNECINPVPNFAGSIICLMITLVIAYKYLFGGRFHRVAFLRQQRVWLNIILRYFSYINEKIEYIHNIKILKQLKEDGCLWKRLRVPTFYLLCILTVPIIALLIYFAFISNVLFSALIIWRGFNLSHLNNLHFIKTMNDFIAVLAEFIPILPYILYPIVATVEGLSKLDLNLSLEGVNVTCNGSQAPFELLLNCAILSFVVIIIESNYQLFWGLLMSNITIKYITTAMSKKYRSLFVKRGNVSRCQYINNGVFSMILLGLLGVLNPFKTVLQYILSFVTINKFIINKGRHPSSTVCDNISGIGQIDSSIAILSTVVALVLLQPALLTLSKIFVPKLSTKHRLEIIELRRDNYKKKILAQNIKNFDFHRRNSHNNNDSHNASTNVNEDINGDSHVNLESNEHNGRVDMAQYIEMHTINNNSAHDTGNNNASNNDNNISNNNDNTILDTRQEQMRQTERELEQFCSEYTNKMAEVDLNRLNKDTEISHSLLGRLFKYLSLLSLDLLATQLLYYYLARINKALKINKEALSNVTDVVIMNRNVTETENSHNNDVDRNNNDNNNETVLHTNDIMLSMIKDFKDEGEEHHWIENVNSVLPSYMELCREVYQELNMFGAIDNRKDTKVWYWLQSRFLIGHLRTRIGRYCWWVVLWNYYTMFCVSFVSYWRDDDIYDVYDLERYNEMVVLTCESNATKNYRSNTNHSHYNSNGNSSDNNHNSNISSNANNHNNNNFNENGESMNSLSYNQAISNFHNEEIDKIKEIEHRENFSRLLFSTVGMRAILFQLSSHLTVASVFAVQMSTSPMFVYSDKMLTKLSDYYIKDSQEIAILKEKIHLKAINDMQLDVELTKYTWIISLNSYLIFFLQSRIFRIIVNMFIFSMSVGILHSNLFVWILLSILVLLVASLVIALQFIIVLGRYFKIQDHELYNICGGCFTTAIVFGSNNNTNQNNGTQSIHYNIEPAVEINNINYIQEEGNYHYTVDNYNNHDAYNNNNNNNSNQQYQRQQYEFDGVNPQKMIGTAPPLVVVSNVNATAATIAESNMIISSSDYGNNDISGSSGNEVNNNSHEYTVEHNHDHCQSSDDANYSTQHDDYV